MDEAECALCEEPLLPGQRRMSWFDKDEANNTTERGAVHMACLMR